MSESAPPTAGAGVEVRPAGIEAHYEVSQFLTFEAGLLDTQRYTEWLELMAPDVVYTMPVRVTTARGAGSHTLGDMAHFDEDHYTLSKRVARLISERAWTEDPPSRTRRFVTNVQVGVLGDGSELEALSYLLLFRSRLDVRPPEWVSAARKDLLRRDGGGLRLARREITVDEAVLRTQNLAIFL